MGKKYSLWVLLEPFETVNVVVPGVVVDVAVMGAKIGLDVVPDDGFGVIVTVGLVPCCIGLFSFAFFSSGELTHFGTMGVGLSVPLATCRFFSSFSSRMSFFSFSTGTDPGRRSLFICTVGRSFDIFLSMFFLSI